MGTDRKTAIQADQIKNNTLGADEFDTENFTSEFNSEIVLQWNPVTQKLKWSRKEQIASVADNFRYDGNDDIEVITLPIFVSDNAGDLMPSVEGEDDFFFEVINDEIIPKI